MEPWTLKHKGNSGLSEPEPLVINSGTGSSQWEGGEFSYFTVLNLPYERNEFSVKRTGYHCKGAKILLLQYNIYKLLNV